MELLVKWLITTVSIIVVAYLLPGVTIKDFVTALVVALVLGLLNIFLKPLLLLLTLPINLLTLGLFTFVINAVIILLVSAFVKGFRVDGFLWALLFSILLSLVSSILYRFTS